MGGNPMGWLGWVVVGGIVGLLARIITKSRQGWLIDMMIGITGATLGGLLFNLSGTSVEPSFNVARLLVAVFAATALLLVSHLAVGKIRPVIKAYDSRTDMDAKRIHR